MTERNVPKMVLLMKPEPGDSTGGAWLQRTLLADLRSAGCSPVCLDPQDPGYIGLGLPPHRRLLQRLRYYAAVLRLVRSEKADLVLFDLYQLSRLWPLPLVLNLFRPGTLVVCTCLSPERLVAGDALERRFAPWFYMGKGIRLTLNKLRLWMAVSGCRQVLVHGPWLGSFLRSILPTRFANRISAFGVGEAVAKPPHHSESIRSGWIGIGYVDPYKGLHRAIEALGLDPGGDLSLDWYGDDHAHNPAYADHCRLRIAELGLADRVRLHGRKPREDVLAACGRARGMLSLAPHEGYGLNHLEAVAHGLALVGPKDSTTAAFVEVGANGYLFEADDPHSLLRAWHQADELDSVRRAQVSHQVFDRHFSMPKLADLLLNFWASSAV